YLAYWKASIGHSVPAFYGHVHFRQTQFVGSPLLSVFQAVALMRRIAHGSADGKLLNKHPPITYPSVATFHHRLDNPQNCETERFHDKKHLLLPVDDVKADK